MVNPKCSHKKLKQLLETEIPEVQFHKSKRVNGAECVTLKRKRDAAVQLMKETSANSEEDMKTLFNEASLLRKAINNSDKMTSFAGSFTDVTGKHLPKELYCFFRLVPHISTDTKSSQVNKHALSTVSIFLSRGVVHQTVVSGSVQGKLPTSC